LILVGIIPTALAAKPENPGTNPLDDLIAQIQDLGTEVDNLWGAVANLDTRLDVIELIDATNVSWSDISDVPSDIADGDQVGMHFGNWSLGYGFPGYSSGWKCNFNYVAETDGIVMAYAEFWGEPLYPIGTIRGATSDMEFYYIIDTFTWNNSVSTTGTVTFPVKAGDPWAVYLSNPNEMSYRIYWLSLESG
jgi:hypothetical protein